MSFWKSILKGFASIGEGFASFNLFPPPTPLPDYDFKRTDSEAIRQDWQAVIGDWEKWEKENQGDPPPNH